MIALQREGLTEAPSVMSRRTFLERAGTLAVGSTAPTWFASCKSETTPSRSAPVKLTVWDYFIPAGKGYLGLFDKYMKLNPNVTIQRTAMLFVDLKQKLTVGGALGQLPDIVVIDNPDHSAFAAKGILVDITAKVKAWGKINQYFAGPVKSTMWQGRYYGIPNNSNCLALYYNKGMFEAAGVTPPTTWEELRTTASKLTQNGVYGYCMSLFKSEENVFQFLPFLWEAGADLATIDSPEAVSALEYVAGFVKDGSLSSESLNWGQLEAITQFIMQKAAMCLNGPWHYPLIKQKAQFRYGVVPIPRGKQEVSILGGENWAITKQSQHVEEAWAFIKWTQEPKQLKDYIVQDVRLPSNKSLAQDPAFQNDPNLAVFIQGLEVAKPRAYGPNYPQISAALQQAIQAAVSGQMSSADALQQAGKVIKPLLPS